MKVSSCARHGLLLVACLVVPVARVSAQQSDQEPSAQSVKSDMQVIENTWSQSLLKHDQYALEGVLAPGFVDISAEGEVTTRNQQIARLFLKDTDAISFQQKVASART